MEPIRCCRCKKAIILTYKGKAVFWHFLLANLVLFWEKLLKLLTQIQDLSCLQDDFIGHGLFEFWIELQIWLRVVDRRVSCRGVSHGQQRQLVALIGMG
jgi:hypothetical protein